MQRVDHVTAGAAGILLSRLTRLTRACAQRAACIVFLGFAATRRLLLLREGMKGQWAVVRKSLVSFQARFGSSYAIVVFVCR